MNWDLFGLVSYSVVMGLLLLGLLVVVIRDHS